MFFYNGFLSDDHGAATDLVDCLHKCPNLQN